jgi:uncharacterized membrane protein YcaP (DUF421 family)
LEQSTTVFTPEKSPLEIVLRVVLIYCFLILLLRLTGKKEMGQLEPMDLLIMLLISEIVSPALTGGDQSLGTAAIASCTLFGLTAIITRITFRSRKAEELIQGRAMVLINNGKIHEDVLRSERITAEQLKTALHKEGLQAVAEVKKAYIEPSGEITFIKKEAESSS